MHVSQLLAAALLGLTGKMQAYEVGPRFEPLNREDIEMAIDCLQENYCSRYAIPKRSNIRCRINNAVAYVCNYAGRPPAGELPADEAKNPCDRNEMKEAAVLIREEGKKRLDGHFHDEYMTGWWFEKDWAKAYGFEQPCPNDALYCENHCGNNFNPNKKTNYFDFDVECLNTPGVGRNDSCILHSITSHWEKTGKIEWPWINDKLNLGLPREQTRT
ncbi:hypothetical protein GQ53DRAFT_158007 [Thozetella sp. PMI_491]|nr:hypothetical protein GQ53DRAFT_158007 [Thozetella sp. PMI_491]